MQRELRFSVCKALDEKGEGEEGAGEGFGKGARKASYEAQKGSKLIRSVPSSSSPSGRSSCRAAV